ncbi:MAG: RNA polymerase sigma factor RpoH [Betaproteobacteria bacterium]|nr:RNA polymerase sigma factor RpoH [Betaproteobacteria bacterium]MBK9609633.1 RNA polymerase sigma factor RpoH [Betaproteobacteria bacterium]
MTNQTIALNFPVPSALGSLDQYIQAVNRFPLLTAEQERDLGTRLQQDNDLDAARQMVMSHLRLVVAVSRQYMGYGLPQGDLIQEGNIGLMKAVRRFDPNRGVRLVSFALHWIKAEIHEYILRNWRMMKVATTKAQRKLFFNLRGMKKSHVGLTREQANEIAMTLKVKPEEVFEMEMRLSSQDVALDPQPNDDGESVSPLAYLTDSDDEPSRILEHAENERNKSAGLARALATLDPRSRKIIEARWLNEGNESTLQTLADEYGVSAERIRQIEVKAMKTMRAQIGAQ